jgi:hypothetical protein
MSQNFTALEDGVYTYATAIGGTSTIRKLVYGVPCDPPPLTPQQLAAIKSKQELDKRIAEQDEISAVRQLQTDATNGNASAQTSLALHYLDGRGCETNRELAVYWLTQAAKQGDEEASNTLANLK